jgi:hypothetical protein
VSTTNESYFKLGRSRSNLVKNLLNAKEGLERFFSFISKLTENGFYGKLVISFEKGKIVNIKREENIKPFDLQF